MDVLAHHALAALAEAGRRIAGASQLDGALDAVAEAAAAATAADVAVVRVADGAGQIRLRAVSSSSAAVAAELEGSRFPAHELPSDEVAETGAVPAAVRAAAARIHAEAVLLVPVWIAGAPAASLEVMRDGEDFGVEETTLARLAAAQLSLALVAFGSSNGRGTADAVYERALSLAGDALSARSGAERIGEQIAYLALEGTGAAGVRLWSIAGDGQLEEMASAGAMESGSQAAFPAARRALEEQTAVRLEHDVTGLVATVRLGIPPLGVLQLHFERQTPPSSALLERLGAFGVRAAHALRSGERLTEMSADLERSQALLAVVGQAIAQLSLAHTLDTAADRVAELLGAERIAVYLREDGGRLHAAHERGLAGPHAVVAERLLDLALGPFRAQGMLHVTDAGADLRLATVRDSVVEAGIDAVVAVPLLVREELIGLVAVYLPLGHEPSDDETTLLTALATQLAVAVQNARLHEDVKRLAAERERALDAEAGRARQLSALHDISSSFATSLSLDATLDAVVRAAVELLGADAAVVRMPDSRSAQLVSRAMHVADPKLADALRPLLERPQPIEGLPGRRLFRMGRALVLEPESAARLGASYELLVPFLAQGSTAAVIPIATPAELLATLTIVSLDPERRLGPKEVDTAVAVARQAALAIDNARLYQQQKGFADTMQRLLLPQELPRVAGLELGAVYESSARLDVGGDVYDFLPLPGGRLAVVLGDVTGHGIEATADMALAKFVFRALAREHPEPGDFFAHANEVACAEVAGGKFITMVYLAFDPERGEVAAARAGHPPARLLAPDGSVSTMAPAGLALGVDPDQRYEEVRAPFRPGSVVCLYTDGIVEARNDGEQYGDARLDAALAAGAGLPAQELAEHVVADCRAFAGSELVDDCAVVVIRRTPE
jgi:serine phosphatase RsbU (regulator of sigma subunit)